MKNNKISKETYLNREKLEKLLADLPVDEKERFIKRALRNIKSIKSKHELALFLHNNWGTLGAVSFATLIASAASLFIGDRGVDRKDILAIVLLAISIESGAGCIYGGLQENDEDYYASQRIVDQASASLSYLKDVKKDYKRTYMKLF